MEKVVMVVSEVQVVPEATAESEGLAAVRPRELQALEELAAMGPMAELAAQGLMELIMETETMEETGEAEEQGEWEESEEDL